MQPWLGLLVLMLVAVTAAPAGAADWSTWQRYMESAEVAWEQGRFAAAEQWLQDAVGEAERQDPRSAQLARSLTVLAEVSRKQGRTSEAQSLAARIPALPPTAPVASGPDVIERLEAYATLLRELGRDVDARTVDARIQRLREVRAGAGRGQLLFFNPVAELREYAALLRQRGRDADARTVDLQAAAEAARLVERYETLRKGYSGPAALPTVTWLQQLSAGQEALEGRLYPEAEGLFRDAVKTAETFGVQDARLPYTLSLLAYALRAQGKRQEFTTTVQRAMPMLEHIAGSQHAYLPRGMNMLALGHLSFGFDGTEALAHFQRSLPLLEKDVRPDHPAIGLQLAGLAASLLALDRADTAEPLLQRAIAIAVAQTTRENAVAARGLLAVVRVYMNRRDYARADAVAERIVAAFRRSLDPDHPDLVLALALRREMQAKAARPAEVASLAGAISVPLETSGNLLFVRGMVNRSHRALLVVDTGASVTSIRPIVLQRLGVAVPANAPRRRLTIVGGATVEVPLVAVALQIGDAVVENLDVAVVEAVPGSPDIDGLLGANFLQRFKVGLDPGGAPDDAGAGEAMIRVPRRQRAWTIPVSRLPARGEAPWPR